MNNTDSQLGFFGIHFNQDNMPTAMANYEVLYI